MPVPAQIAAGLRRGADCGDGTVGDGQLVRGRKKYSISCNLSAGLL